MDILEIFFQSGIVGIVGGIIAILIEKRWLARSIERYKSEMRQEEERIKTYFQKDLQHFVLFNQKKHEVHLDIFQKMVIAYSYISQRVFYTINFEDMNEEEIEEHFKKMKINFSSNQKSKLVADIRNGKNISPIFQLYYYEEALSLTIEANHTAVTNEMYFDKEHFNKFYSYNAKMIDYIENFKIEFLIQKNYMQPTDTKQRNEEGKKLHLDIEKEWSEIRELIRNVMSGIEK